MFKPEVISKVDEDISILVKLDNYPWNYLCDCGDASNLSVRDVQNTRGVLISHTHLDHFVNFDMVIRHQIGTERRVFICGPPNIAKEVQARVKSYTWNLIEKGALVFEVREVEEDNTFKVYELHPPKWRLKSIGHQEGNVILKEESFDISFVKLDHKCPSIAYRFQEKDKVKIDLSRLNLNLKGGKWVSELKKAYINHQPNETIRVEEENYKASDLYGCIYKQAGKSLGIIMDHAADQANHQKIIQHFNACNKVFIECFYKVSDRELAEANYHSYTSQSAKVMKQAQVREAIPVHFSRKYQETDIQELIKEFEEEFFKE